MAESCSDNTLENFNYDIQNGRIPSQLMPEHSSQSLSHSQCDVQIGEIMDNVSKSVANAKVYFSWKIKGRLDLRRFVTFRWGDKKRIPRNCPTLISVFILLG